MVMHFFAPNVQLLPFSIVTLRSIVNLKSHLCAHTSLNTKFAQFSSFFHYPGLTPVLDLTNIDVYVLEISFFPSLIQELSKYCAYPLEKPVKCLPC